MNNMLRLILLCLITPSFVYSSNDAQSEASDSSDSSIGNEEEDQDVDVGEDEDQGIEDGKNSEDLVKEGETYETNESSESSDNEDTQSDEENAPEDVKKEIKADKDSKEKNKKSAKKDKKPKSKKKAKKSESEDQANEEEENSEDLVEDDSKQDKKTKKKAKKNSILKKKLNIDAAKMAEIDSMFTDGSAFFELTGFTEDESIYFFKQQSEREVSGAYINFANNQNVTMNVLKAIIELLEQTPKAIKSLDLSGCPIGDVGALELFIENDQNKLVIGEVRRITLQKCGITMLTREFLTNFCLSMVEIDLTDNNLTPDTIVLISGQPEEIQKRIIYSLGIPMQDSSATQQVVPQGGIAQQQAVNTGVIQQPQDQIIQQVVPQGGIVQQPAVNAGVIQQPQDQMTQQVVPQGGIVQQPAVNAGVIQQPQDQLTTQPVTIP